MKCFRILPEICARTSCPFSIRTLNRALGKLSTTTPSTTTASDLAVGPGGLSSASLLRFLGPVGRYFLAMATSWVRVPGPFQRFGPEDAPSKNAPA